MSDAQCMMNNCRRSAPATEPFCFLHRQLQAKGGSLNMRSLAFITDLETRVTSLEALLLRSREYVLDALEAHEHTDGRNLLNEIDATLGSKP